MICEQVMVSLRKQDSGARWVLAAAACGALLFGCSSRDHAPFVPAEPSGTSNPGRSGATGMTPDESDSGAGGSSESGGGSESGGSTGGTGSTTNEGDAGESSTDGNPAVYDPESVYLFGTLQPPTCQFNAVALLSTPNSYSVGFGCYANDATLQIWKSHLVYSDGSSVLRIFVPEYSGSTQPSSLKYPEDPAKNDTVVDTAPCPSGDHLTPRFLSSPDGRLIYRCANGEVWYEAGAQVYDGKEMILAFGFDGLALVGNALTGFGVMKLSDGVVLKATGFDSVGAVRAHEDGFHFVVPGKKATDHLDAALWKIDTSGNAERIAVYPGAPVTLGDVSAKLMSNDDIYAKNGDFGDAILRITPQGASTEVYTEANRPNVQMQTSSLFTGP